MKTAPVLSRSTEAPAVIGPGELVSFIALHKVRLASRKSAFL
jgi:hypothetical protein